MGCSKKHSSAPASSSPVRIGMAPNAWKPVDCGQRQDSLADLAGDEVAEAAAPARQEVLAARDVPGRDALEPGPEGARLAGHGVGLEVMARLDQQVADAGRAQGLSHQADRPVGQFLERTGLLADARQLVQRVQAMAQGALCRGPMQQLRPQPEVGQRDAADAADRLQEVVVELLRPGRLRPFEVERARAPDRRRGAAARPGRRPRSVRLARLPCERRLRAVWPPAARATATPVPSPGHRASASPWGSKPPLRRTPQWRLGWPTQTIGSTTPEDGIDQDVAAAGGPGRDRHRLDGLLRQAVQIVGGGAQERQLLEGAQLGRQATFVLGRLVEPAAHPDVGVGDRDDAADGFDGPLVDLRGAGRRGEVADEGARHPARLSKG